METTQERIERIARERALDMTYDGTGRARVAESRNAFAEHRARLAAERAARNPDLAKRLAAGQQQNEHQKRLAQYAEKLDSSGLLLAQVRTANLMRLQDRRVVNSSTEPTPFDD